MTVDRFAAVAALPGVGEAAQRVAAALDRLARRRTLQLDPGQIRAELTLRAARAGALLAGREVDMVALREATADDDAVRAAMRIVADLPALLPVWEHAPRQALARLHTLAASENTGAEHLGRPASAAAAARLDVLADALAEKTTAPAVVVAAIVHAEVLHSAAFGEAGGLVARAAARLVLIGRGADPHGVVAPELGHAAMGLTEYQKALGLYGNGGATGVAAWIVHCAQAVDVAVLEASQVAMVVRPGVRASAYGRAEEN
ncbi:MAG: oxidoreductase [Sporichthyaceae bacterium]